MTEIDEKVLGTYTVRKTGNANSVTIPASSGFSKGDTVILILKSNGNLEIKKSKANFWDMAPVMTEKEKKQELRDLGCNPLEQQPKGREKIQ